MLMLYDYIFYTKSFKKSFIQTIIITQSSKQTKVLVWTRKMLNMNRKNGYMLILHDYQELSLQKNI